MQHRRLRGQIDSRARLVDETGDDDVLRARVVIERRDSNLPHLRIPFSSTVCRWGSLHPNWAISYARPIPAS